MKKRFFKILFAFLSAIYFSGCFVNKEEISIELNEDSYALSPTINWCVVTAPYASFRENPSLDAQILTHCRQGDIFRIESVRIEENSRWYLLFDEQNQKKGFIEEISIKVCENKYRAKTESKSFK